MKTWKKVWSVITIFVLLLSFVKPVTYAKEEKPVAKKVKYMIQTENLSGYTKMKNEFRNEKKLFVNHKDSDEEYLKEPRSVVAELTKDEAASFSEEEGVTVERDYSVKADSTDSGEAVPDDTGFIPVEVSPKQKYEEEYTDKPEEFEPCKKVTDPKKKNEVVPWNIACVAGTPSQNKYRGKHIKVAVIDSGIDTHDELNTKGWVDFSDRVNGYKPVDNSGHGTSMAGVIAARINGIGFEGIADEAELYSVKIFDRENTASVSTVVKAIEWCIANDIDIINMSFGMEHPSSILAGEIKKAYDRGILMIGAAGNDTSEIQYPAAYPEVISVGSIDPNLNASDFSDNDKVDLVAPGEDAQTIAYLGAYGIAEGTSIAAAHVTGVAAAVKSAKRKAGNAQLREALCSSAVILKDKSRLVNYQAAVAAIKKASRIPAAASELQEITSEMAEDKDAYVAGSWMAGKWLDGSNTGHEAMVNAMDFTSSCLRPNTETEGIHNKWIVARAAHQTDGIKQLSAADDTFRDANGVVVAEEKGGTRMLSPYHAKSQYALSEVLSHLHFLYELTRRRLILRSNLDLNAGNYKGNTYYGVSIPLQTKKRIIADLNVLYKDLETTYKNTINMNTVMAKGYMVLGVFLHLVQDIQAHRAVVNPSMVFRSSQTTDYYTADVMGETISNSRINGTNILNAATGSYLFRIFKEQGPMPIIRLKDFLKNDKENNILCTVTVNGKTYRCSASDAYEDNPYFYRRRYSTAQQFSVQYVNRMISDSGSTSTQLNTFFRSADVPIYEKKCSKFK